MAQLRFNVEVIAILCKLVLCILLKKNINIFQNTKALHCKNYECSLKIIAHLAC